MSPSVELPGRVVIAPPITPDVIVQAPVVPGVTMAPPDTGLVVVPVSGPRGLRGPAGDETGLGFVHSQTQPVTLVQVQHGFPFRPAGIDCIETAGDPPLLGVGVSHPALGITELTFGAPFTGTIYLS